MHSQRKSKIVTAIICVFILVSFGGYFLWYMIFRTESSIKGNTIVTSDNITESNNSDLTKELKTNHGIVNINYKDTGHNDDTEEYVFINNDEGWRGLIAPGGAGSDSLDLYKTIDGGINWTNVTTLASGGDFIFLNSDTGWIITNPPINGVLSVLKTCDGGITWNEENIQVPSEYKYVQFSSSLPVFFSQLDGIIISLCRDSNSNYEYLDPVAFITHDGGETWNIFEKSSVDDNFKWDINEKEKYREINYNNSIWKSTNTIEWYNSK